MAWRYGAKRQMTVDNFSRGEGIGTDQLKCDAPSKPSHLLQPTVTGKGGANQNTSEWNRADRLLCHLLVSIVTSRNDRTRLSDLLALESLCDTLLHDSSRVHTVFSVLDAIVCNDTPLVLEPKQKKSCLHESTPQCGSMGCADDASSTREGTIIPTSNGSTTMARRVPVVSGQTSVSSSQLPEHNRSENTGGFITKGGLACPPFEGSEKGRVVQFGFEGLSSRVMTKRHFSEIARCFAMETFTALLTALGGPALGGMSLGIPWTERLVGVLHLLIICEGSETFRSRAVGCLHELETSIPGTRRMCLTQMKQCARPCS